MEEKLRGEGEGVLRGGVWSFGTAVLGATALLGLTATGAIAQNAPGVSKTSIKIGNTNPYSGPASSYSTIGKTIKAYFDYLNARGGINGRRLDFVSLDDGYSPPKTVEQIRRLVERDRVAFIFQSLGTPTNTAIHSYMNQRRVPQLFVATGASKWGQPSKFPWTMGWQPNYKTEGAIYANYLKQNKPRAKVAVLYQNDDYGKDYLEGFEESLGESLAQRMIIAKESYEVADPTVDSQIVNLKATGADVFFNVSIPKFAAQAIRKSYDIGWRPLHFLNSVSNSVSSVMVPAGIEKSEGILSTAFTMDPTDAQWFDHPEYREWLAFMAQYYPSGDLANAFHVYGYAVGQTLEHVLRNAGDDLSRENIMRQAANIRGFHPKGLLPGISINTSATDFYPIEALQLQRFTDEGSWEFLGDVISAESS